MSEFKYELGYEATDVVTGFKGTISGRVQYITGCNQYQLSTKSKNGDFHTCWFDEHRLKVGKKDKAYDFINQSYKVETPKKLTLGAGPSPVKPKGNL